MAEAVRFGRRRGPGQREEERRQLMEGMRETRSQLNYAYAQFNAQQSRYSYYVRQVKQLEAAREGAG